jgi:hypothetical protein
MRKTASRLSRAAVTAAALAMVLAGVNVVEAPAASAATCSGVGGYLCGALKNRTGRTIYKTENLGDGGGFCDVWNKGGGPGSEWWHAPCDQQQMGNGTRGGNGTHVDVDAFTFVSSGYHERFSRVGSWHWRTGGVWTKIRDGEIADCGIGDNNEIWCTLLWQA